MAFLKYKRHPEWLYLSILWVPHYSLVLTAIIGCHVVEVFVQNPHMVVPSFHLGTHSESYVLSFHQPPSSFTMPIKGSCSQARHGTTVYHGLHLCVRFCRSCSGFLLYFLTERVHMTVRCLELLLQVPSTTESSELRYGLRIQRLGATTFPR